MHKLRVVGMGFELVFVYAISGDAEHTACGSRGAGTAEEIHDLRSRENSSETERHGPGQSGQDVLGPAP